jgi:hypothetical protein
MNTCILLTNVDATPSCEYESLSAVISIGLHYEHMTPHRLIKVPGFEPLARGRVKNINIDSDYR